LSAQISGRQFRVEQNIFVVVVVVAENGNIVNTMNPTPPTTPPFGPTLHVDDQSFSVKPKLHIDVDPPRYNLPSPPSTPKFQSSAKLPESPKVADGSMRSILLSTIDAIPEHVISPSSWEFFSDADLLTPLTLCYFARETNITVQITGYANGQYVVRLLGRQGGCGDMPLVAVSVSEYRKGGEWQDVPTWRIRQKLIEKVEWDQGLA